MTYKWTYHDLFNSITKCLLKDDVRVKYYDVYKSNEFMLELSCDNMNASVILTPNNARIHINNFPIGVGNITDMMLRLYNLNTPTHRFVQVTKELLYPNTSKTITEIEHPNLSCEISEVFVEVIDKIFDYETQEEIKCDDSWSYERLYQCMLNPKAINSFTKTYSIS